MYKQHLRNLTGDLRKSPFTAEKRSRNSSSKTSRKSSSRSSKCRYINNICARHPLRRRRAAAGAASKPAARAAARAAARVEAKTEQEQQ